MKEILYIIIPAYNEESTIDAIITGWYPVIERHQGNGSSRLVIIDDGSEDNTWRIITGKSAHLPLLLPIKKENSGHGASVLYGYYFSIKEKADYIFQTDSDGQTDPEEFEKFWDLRKDFDMVIGHRKYRKDGFSRKIITKVLRFVIWAIFHENITDVNTPYRLMETKCLERYIGLIPDEFNLTNVLIPIIYARKGRKVMFLPITFKERQGGINSINMKKIFIIGCSALKDFFDLEKELQKELRIPTEK